ncbi:hypothetical protein SAMN05444008_11324 [Cnuella takakiae]|uniref:Outer membrane lipoprotein-sorting protein n=1 Tax=Cnuella takakiae TaxID=1302690 RepID=A0A1M5F3P3_9BACT|nr:hypothetical protein [Cnuella takakiae]OLY90960.1 hypothetical protein BUE76_02885 [Cnuella takakiae]SHF86075.1 hypothetical protein SAMN05444008_11324 [Cnuella takakiae]
MQFVKTAFLAAATLAVTYGAHAQTADELIAKHVAALGGMEKIKGINSLVMKTKIEVMGNEAEGTQTLLTGKGFRSESEIMGNKMVQVVTDKGGWSINPMTGGGAQPIPEEQYKAAKDQLDIAGPLVDYASKGNKLELQGREKVGSVDAYKLKLTAKDGGLTTFYLDPNTYYIIQSVKQMNMMGQDVEMIVSMADYKKTDYGFVMPHTINTDFGGQFQIATKVSKVDVNTPVDTKIFEMPK